MTATTLRHARTPEIEVADDAPGRTGLPLPALLLLAALAAGTRAQGGFYIGGQLLIGAILAASLFATLRRGRLRIAELGWPAMWATALGGWSLAGCIAAHHGLSAIPGLGLLAGLVAAFVVTARLTVSGRRLFVDAMTAVGVMAALSGWIGVGLHVGPLAHVDQGLWRAATTLTYANAAAGLLVPIACVAFGKLAESLSRRETMVRSAAVTVLLVGVGATFSRGGVLAGAVGLAVVFVVLGDRSAIARSLVGPVAGACIAMAGLLPSVPESASPHLLTASVLLIVGVCVSAVIGRVLTGRREVRVARHRPSVRRLLTVAVVVAAVSVLALNMSTSVRRAATEVAHPRLTATSDDRVGESSAALHDVARQPILGAGAGTQTLHWAPSPDTVSFDRFAHDEYVQVAWKSGVVGVGLLLAMFAAFARRISHGRRNPASAGLWAGSVAGLCALAAASGLDFLWHVPVIPLVGAVLAGFCTATEGRVP
jgi:hypothetical protein